MFNACRSTPLYYRGAQHTVLLTTDGGAVGFGDNSKGQCEIEPPPTGMSYTQAHAAEDFTLLLRSDGVIITFGEYPNYAWAKIPSLPAGTKYVQVIEAFATVGLVRNDGAAFLVDYAIDGCYTWHERCQDPDPHRVPAPSGEKFLQVCAGRGGWYLLQSDGSIVHQATRHGFLGRTSWLELEGQGSFVAIASWCSLESEHLVALRRDGSVVCMGDNRRGQCEVPELVDDLVYTDVAAGAEFTLLLRSDGEAVAFGRRGLRCTVPSLPVADGAQEAVRYVSVMASGCDRAGGVIGDPRKKVRTRGHAALVRSDGLAVAFGFNGSGQCNIPGQGVLHRWLGTELRFRPPSPPPRPALRRLLTLTADSGRTVVCTTLTGDEFSRCEIPENVDCLNDILVVVRSHIDANCDIVPDESVHSLICAAKARDSV